jgi:hypothetical protein
MTIVKSMAARLVAVLAGGVLLGTVTAAHASLIGQSVGCSATSSELSSLFNVDCSSATAVVQSPGAEFGVRFPNISSVDSWSIDIDDASILITQVHPNATSIPDSTVDVVLSELFWVEDPSVIITGFTLQTSGVTGFIPPDVSVSDNTVAVDLGSGAFWELGSSATITLITSQEVPEPGTLAMFGLGLVGLTFVRRRKAAQSEPKR